MTFAAQLKAARKQAKLTTIELGARLGVAANVITYWEKGHRVPDEDRQKIILAALDKPALSLTDLVAGLQADIAARIAKFAIDLQTAQQGPLRGPLSASDAEEALAMTTPATTSATPQRRARTRP